MSTVDLDANGKLDFREFRRMVLKQVGLTALRISVGLTALRGVGSAVSMFPAQCSQYLFQPRVVVVCECMHCSSAALSTALRLR
jgi:hypothetical protein